MRRAAPVALIALCVLAVGCGELGGDTKPKKRAPIVSASDLDRYPPGSPARALLEWFQALQVRDANRMAKYYLPSLGLTPAELARQRQAAAYGIDTLAPPIIERVIVNGDRAMITAQNRGGSVTPNGRVDYTRREVAPFTLQRHDGRWLLVDNGYLALVARDPSPEANPLAVPKVGPAQLSRYSPGSPVRAFLEWFGALQRHDAAKAVRYYDPSLGLSARELARVRESATVFDMYGPPRVVSVSERGSEATVKARNRVVSAGAGGKLRFSESPPIPFYFTRVNGRWVQTGNGFLEILARMPPR